jgi:adenosylcobinamide kinase/adenosylcobinamide-phosphate guanylyltransferase
MAAGVPVALTYPVSLRMHGRLAVVVGGGPVAARQVAGLCAAGAQILVIAPVLDPALDPALAELASRGRIAVRRRSYLAADLDGAWLVLACTGQPHLDAAVAADAERQRTWCVQADGAVPGSQPAGDAVTGSEPAGGGRRVLVLGGARSGKSANAEAMLAGLGPVDYIATGPPAGAGDAEWDARVADHRERRAAHWRTEETLGLDRVLAAPDLAPVLIECVATWLARVMDDHGVWSGDPGADLDLAARLDRLVEAWRATRRYAVAISNEVGSGVHPATASGRRFRDELGRLNARIAAESDEVWLCTAGISQRLR